MHLIWNQRTLESASIPKTDSDLLTNPAATQIHKYKSLCVQTALNSSCVSLKHALLLGNVRTGSNKWASLTARMAAEKTGTVFTLDCKSKMRLKEIRTPTHLFMYLLMWSGPRLCTDGGTVKGWNHVSKEGLYSLELLRLFFFFIFFQPNRRLIPQSICPASGQSFF